jgi:hypothetical protein
LNKHPRASSSQLPLTLLPQAPNPLKKVSFSLEEEDEETAKRKLNKKKEQKGEII